jgi:hypothetical protein
MKTKVAVLCLALIFSGMQVFAQLSKAGEEGMEKESQRIRQEPV